MHSRKRISQSQAVTKRYCSKSQAQLIYQKKEKALNSQYCRRKQI
jgi:hypothetical protein